jgi:hypothetical protein
MRTGIWQGGRLRLLTGLIMGLALIGAARAADLREFIQETQQTATQAQQLTLTWWIPEEFWDLSLANNANVPPQTAQDIRAVFHDYQVFALLRASTGLQGLAGVATKADLLGNSRLEIGGKVISPVDADKVPAGVQAMLGAMRPMLASILGQLGQSMELVVYPAMVDGHRLIDPLKPGSFQFTLYDQAFHWRLPLASLLPKKIDPKSKEEFPGNYDYNPYTGGKLSVKPGP